jgi:prepilin-type N-terminal cleavage/methylation domain-containing protein
MSIRYGFSFIEIIVAILISSFLSLVLYNSLSQTQRTMRQVTSLMNETADLLPFMAQFEKDLAGIFAPATDTIATNTSLHPSTPPSSSSGLKAMSERGDALTDTAHGEPVESMQRQEKKLFHATNKSGSLSELTFITTNALALPNEASARAVRVTYRLVPQQDAVGRFVLTRAEEPYGPQKDKKVGRPYPLVNNIHKFVVHYSGLEGQEEKDKNKQKKMVRLQEWGTSSAQEKTKQKLPVLVEIEAIFIHKEGTELPVIYAFSIPAGSCQEEKQKTQQEDKAQQEKEIKQPGKQPTKPAKQGPAKASSMLIMGGKR